MKIERINDEPVAEEVYADLESRMLTYDDIVDVPVTPCNEPLVPIRESRTVAARQLRDEMLPVTGERIYVRRTVAVMLEAVGVRLDRARPGTQLQVGYGYRSLAIQTKNFERQKELLRGTVPDERLDAEAHRRVAIPTIAGHPTGGAVDVRLLQNGEIVDCGTDMWEFVRDSYTFSPYIGKVAMGNRMLLRDTMEEVGFAPYDGEWWHFSYGDKEWAAYKGRPAATYEQTEFSADDNAQV